MSTIASEGNELANVATVVENLDSMQNKSSDGSVQTVISGELKLSDTVVKLHTSHDDVAKLRSCSEVFKFEFCVLTQNLEFFEHLFDSRLCLITRLESKRPTSKIQAQIPRNS